MARPIFIPLASGLQTEIADRLVTPGSTLIAENTTRPQTGSVEVRTGSDVLSTASQATIPSGGTLPVPWQLATLGGSLLRLGRAPIPIHTWAEQPNAWVVPANEGGIETYRRGPIKLDTSPVFAGSAQVSDVDVAVGTDSIVCVYRIDTGFSSTSGGVVVILDRTTRKPVYTRRTLNNLGHPRVVIVGSRAVVAYESGGFLQVDSYNLSSYTLSQQQTMGALLSGTAIDMRVGSPVAGANNVGILYRTVTSGNLTLATVDATNLVSNSTNTPRTTAAAVVVPNLGFGWMQDLGASSKFAIMIADTTNGLQTLWDMPAPAGGFTDATATHVLDAAATAGLRNIIGTTIDSTAAGKYRVLYEVDNAAPVVIKVAVWTGGAASTGTQFRNVGIRSKLWTHSTNFYFLSAFSAADQRSYFVLAVAGDTTLTSTTYAAPLAVSHPRDASGYTESTNAMSAAPVDADGAIYIGVTQETRTDSVASGGTATGGTSRLLGVDVIRVRHPTTAETEVGRPAEYLRSLFVPGGGFAFFDGTTYGLAGFAYYPTGASAVSQAGGNLEASANYFYRFVYRFIDKNGRAWRSAPSTPVPVSTTGTDFKFQLTIDTLRLVDRGLATGHNGYSIEAYRTQANSDQGYFMVATIDNDPTANSVVFVDNVADASLGEQLYTDGGGVENQLLPPVSCAVEHQGRMVVSEAGTGTLWYSLEADFQSGPIFNEALTFDVGDPAEPITGLAVLNEQLFVFKAPDKVYLVGGSGANALGQGATYAYRLLDGGVGCDNPQSIAVADGGVWFRSSGSRAGIHRTNGGEPEYMGQGVRAYDSLTITGTVVVPDKTQIRWYTLEGTTLVWDWTTKTWSTNTDQTCLTATKYGDGVVYARAADSYVMTESTSSYKEGTTAFFANLRTPWFQTGIGGWERVKRIQGIGRVPAGRQHTTRVLIYKDMDEFTPIMNVTKVFDNVVPAQNWDWEIRPPQQKCTAMMIQIVILGYQPASVVITPGADTFDGFDIDLGTWLWTFPNGSFSAGNVGDVIVIVGGTKAGTYTITHVVTSTQVGMTPDPGGGTGAISATTITLVPQLQYTAGPKMVGVSLIAAEKEGLAKLPAARRAT